MTLKLAAVLCLALVSITLASVEAAFYLLKRRRLGVGPWPPGRAELAARYLLDPPALLMPIHIGTFTAHVAMTVLLCWLFVEGSQPWALGLAFGSMLTYLLLFRLTIPYLLARRRPERLLAFFIPAFDLYARALGPLVRALRPSRDGDAEHPAGADEATYELPPPPVHDSDEERRVDALARFSETQVREIMTPRPDIVAIAASATVGELRQLVRETRYSRIPTYGENLDDIVGIVTVRDLVTHSGQPHEPLGDLARRIFMVPETKRIAELLREMQARQTTFAAVIDEYGGTVGVVSVEDIVEELVGEIKDEFDVEIEPIELEPSGAVVASGRLTLDRLEQALETAVGEDTEVETVGGLVTSIFGHVPQPGERVEFRGFQLEVLDAERKRVNQVRFTRLARPDA